mmetsp:Transcript_16169/g.41168  ORF Transcript_16169/g.41168 Transcript_16169/m.41168 type:complete len:226 (-) Transcript_16169:102-779(-)
MPAVHCLSKYRSAFSYFSIASRISPRLNDSLPNSLICNAAAARFPYWLFAIFGWSAGHRWNGSPSGCTSVPSSCACTTSSLLTMRTVVSGWLREPVCSASISRSTPNPKSTCPTTTPLPSRDGHLPSVMTNLLPYLYAPVTGSLACGSMDTSPLSLCFRLKAASSALSNSLFASRSAAKAQAPMGSSSSPPSSSSAICKDAAAACASRLCLRCPKCRFVLEFEPD